MFSGDNRIPDNKAILEMSEYLLFYQLRQDRTPGERGVLLFLPRPAGLLVVYLFDFLSALELLSQMSHIY